MHLAVKNGLLTLNRLSVGCSERGHLQFLWMLSDLKNLSLSIAWQYL